MNFLTKSLKYINISTKKILIFFTIFNIYHNILLVKENLLFGVGKKGSGLCVNGKLSRGCVKMVQLADKNRD